MSTYIFLRMVKIILALNSNLPENIITENRLTKGIDKSLLPKELVMVSIFFFFLYFLMVKNILKNV